MPADLQAVAHDLFDTDTPDWTTAKLQQHIVKTAQALRIDPALALSIAHQESGFDPNAKSPTGVQGVFQVTNATGAQYGQTPQTRTNPVVSTNAGLRYFKDLLTDAGGDVRKALMRYNGGSDPQFDDNVLRHYALHAQSLPDVPVNKTLRQKTLAWLAPRSAEAAPTQAPTAVQSVDLYAVADDLFGPATPATAQPPAQPSPPTAMSTPAQDAAYRAANQQQPTPAPQPSAPTAPLPTVVPHPDPTQPATLQYPGEVAGQTTDMTPPVTPSGPVFPAPGLPAAETIQVDPETGIARLKMDVEKPRPDAGQPGAQPDIRLNPEVPNMRDPRQAPPVGTPDVPQPVPEHFPGLEQVGQNLPPWARTVAATGISMAGAGGGALAGGLPGELAGSAAARWLNVKLGVEEPGVVGDVASVAVPAVARGLGAAWRAGVRNAPGASRIGHEMAQETLEQLPGRFAPQTASDVLFQQAAQQSADIPVTNLAQQASEIITHEMGLTPKFRQTRLLGAARDLWDLTKQYGNNIPLQVLDDYRKRLGLMVGQASAENWPHVSGLKQLYSAVMGDIEKAASSGIAGADTLQQAIKAARTEFALNDLAALWQPGRGIATVDGDMIKVNGARILNQFNHMVATDTGFRGSFAPGELDAIRATLRDVAHLTARSPQSGMGAEFKQALQAAGAGMGIHQFVQGNPIAGAAWIGGAQVAPALLAYALRTEMGRNAIRKAFQEGGGRLAPEGLALINQAVRTSIATNQLGTSPSIAPQAGAAQH